MNERTSYYPPSLNWSKSFLLCITPARGIEGATKPHQSLIETPEKKKKTQNSLVYVHAKDNKKTVFFLFRRNDPGMVVERKRKR
jgi:hypothetical protein